MNKTEAIVRQYHEAFHRGDRAAVRALLADRGDFIGPLSSFTDPEIFLDAASVFWRIHRSTQIKAVITGAGGAGNDVCVVYDYTTTVPSIPTLPLAAWFKVEGEKIRFFHIHFDPTAVVRALAPSTPSKE